MKSRGYSNDIVLDMVRDIFKPVPIRDARAANDMLFVDFKTGVFHIVFFFFRINSILFCF